MSQGPGPGPSMFSHGRLAEHPASEDQHRSIEAPYSTRLMLMRLRTRTDEDRGPGDRKSSAPNRKKNETPTRPRRLQTLLDCCGFAIWKEDEERIMTGTMRIGNVFVRAASSL